MEWAFQGPLRLSERLGGLDAAAIARMDPDELEAACRQTPAVHRFPGSMAKRIQALCQALVEDHDGRAEQVWQDVDTGTQLLRRLKALPGFGDQKARIFLALLAKQCGVTPEGWQDAAVEYGQPGYRSIADVVDAGSIERVREFKRARKAERKG